MGSIIEYNLQGINAHPFHNHVNSFQLTADPADTASGWFRAGDWHDVLISPNNELNVRLQVRRTTSPAEICWSPLTLPFVVASHSPSHDSRTVADRQVDRQAGLPLPHPRA